MPDAEKTPVDRLVEQGAAADDAAPGAIAGQPQDAHLDRGQIAASLSLWRDGATRTALVDFLDSVVNGEHPVDPADRIAAFDNDGTLALERPHTSVLEFFADRTQSSVPGRLGGAAGNLPVRVPKSVGRLVAQTVSGPVLARSVDDYTQQAGEFIARYRHPRFHRGWDKLVYSPMLQLIDLLLQLGFTVFIVSGTSRDFLRVLAPAYHLNRSEIIGSEAQIRYRGGRLVRARTLPRVDIGAQKPEHLWNRCGSHALLAMGNTHHDIPLLASARFGAMVCHDDAEREYRYTDRRAQQAAREHGWTLVSMRDDFAEVFGE